jgi:uncharacterized membrane protein
VSPRPATQASLDAERVIGRLLIVITYAAVALLIIGVVLMATHGIGPMDQGPQFAPAALVRDLFAGEPNGVLWLGLILVIAAPIARVIAAGFGYARQGDRQMVLIACAILIVIALGVASALLTEA